MHLVLRVQTDDALRLDTETTHGAAAGGRRGQGRWPTSPSPASTRRRFKVDGVPPAQDAAFREAAVEVETRFNRESGTGGSARFVMKPNMARAAARRRRRAGAADHRAPRQRAGRGRADRGADRRGGRPDHGAAAGRGRIAQRAKDIIRSTALLELKLVEDGPATHEGAAAAGPRRRAAGQHGGRARRRATRRARRPRRDGLLPGPQGRRRSPGRDLRNAKPSLDETNRPAVSFSLNTDGRAQVRQGDRREHRPPPRDHPRRPRAVGAGHRGRASSTRAASRARSRSRRSRTSRSILRSGALPASLTYLEERTVGPSARGRLDPVGRDGGPRRAGCWS
ncbi:MAG: hypothetical protein M0C28_13205 [Candidatus Moduliflexus flocculans]|nr:hypothetical protein [Candidatus Moduliflexus flocculans]